jgi:hypothetical protein
LVRSSKDIIRPYRVGAKLRALKIAYPTLSYEEALQKSNIKLLSTRKEEACRKLINSLRDQDSPHNPLTAIVKSGLPDRTHNYELRNNNPQLLLIMTERLNGTLLPVKHS